MKCILLFYNFSRLLGDSLSGQVHMCTVIVKHTLNAIYRPSKILRSTNVKIITQFELNLQHELAALKINDIH